MEQPGAGGSGEGGGDGKAMINGNYATESGSRVEITGDYGGIVDIAFDWVEEPMACCDCCGPFVHDGFLCWGCPRCGGGAAELRRKS